MSTRHGSGQPLTALADIAAPMPEPTEGSAETQADFASSAVLQRASECGAKIVVLCLDDLQPPLVGAEKGGSRLLRQVQVEIAWRSAVTARSLESSSLWWAYCRIVSSKATRNM